MKKELFIQLQEFVPLTCHISGLVMPSKILAKRCSWHLLKCGYLSEICHLVHPSVDRIVQNQSPVVKVPFSTALKVENEVVGDLVSDYMLYLLQAFPQCREYQAKLYIVRTVYGLIRTNPLKNFYKFICRHFSLASLDYCYPGMLLLDVYMIILLLQKCIRFVKRLVERCWK